MGSTFAKGKGNTNATTATSEPTSAELPYIWAIRDPTILDWRNDKYNPADPEAEAAFNKQRRANQANLPVSIGEPTTGLFLGDAKCARNIERLNELGINCIINVASEASKNYDLDTDYLKSGINILRLSAEDEEGFPMLELHLKTVMDQINKWKAVTDKQRNCLVHCTAGINRSGVLVAALLMEQEQMTVLDVVRHVSDDFFFGCISNECVNIYD